jgi:hypothetical protein
LSEAKEVCEDTLCFPTIFSNPKTAKNYVQSKINHKYDVTSFTINSLPFSILRFSESAYPLLWAYSIGGGMPVPAVK